MKLEEFKQRFYHARNITPEPDYPLRQKGKPAAVLIPLVMRDELSVLLTRRASHLKHHAGQISFPGGRVDDTDIDLKATALRETEEEIGLKRENIDIVGTLPTFRTISRYEVTPYVSLVKPDFDLVINQDEVDQVFEVPLATVINHDNHLVHTVKRNNSVYPVYFIPWQEHMIWGATAAFIRALSRHLT
ncbi:CoA pyrophosphatase [Planctobacterium marinum]|uniref:CoA pyrophosphatase n=1 Tax=Planctobacterium marinum TaxID=1631968 RepID=UPI001E5A9105|nr:CoA pyrophosphatase [Planctobacterium marinum]MCC2603922.1 CoA pyrophosphatase [Planctobacterium marinum]